MPNLLDGLGRMAGKWVLGKHRRLPVVDRGRFVERVLPAEHTIGWSKSSSRPSRRSSPSTPHELVLPAEQDSRHHRCRPTGRDDPTRTAPRPQSAALEPTPPHLIGHRAAHNSATKAQRSAKWAEARADSECHRHVVDDIGMGIPGSVTVTKFGRSRVQHWCPSSFVCRTILAPS